MRALVGRTADDALARALAERGIEAVFAPLLDIVALPPAADLDSQLTASQALLFTSANGVRALAAVTGRRDRQVFAVGDATADVARAAGFDRVVSAEGDVRDLAALVSRTLDPGRGSLVHLCGRDVAGDPVGTLREKGFTAEAVVLYEARPVEALPSAILTGLVGENLDIAMFFSPRSVRIFVSLVCRAGLAERCARLTLFTLSAAIDAAAELPWQARYVAARPAMPALLAAIDDWRAAGKAAR